MPKHIQQPEDLGDFPKLNDNAQCAAKLRVGTSKWYRIRDQIERVRIGDRDFWTDEALLRYARKNTLKPGERRRMPRTDAVAKARAAAKHHKVASATGGAS